MSTTPPALRIRDFSLSLSEQSLIQHWNLTIQPGETVALMGASGSGKSTLLSWVSGSLPPAFRADGELWLGENRLDQLPSEQRRVGLLFQDALLFPHLSVEENLLFGVSANLPQKERLQRVHVALQEAEMPDFAHHDPATLSGGQRARISLMRTLLAEPRALLLDEPYARLDQQLRTQFRAFVHAHAAMRQLPVLLVTHDPSDVPPDSRCIDMQALTN